MSKIKNWLLKPYPFLEQSSLKLALAFGLGLIVFLILVVFRPFGLSSVDSVTFLSGIGGITTLILLLHLFLFPVVFPRHFSITNWSVYKQLILFCSILLFVSILNYLYNSIIGEFISPQYGLIEFIWMTSAVGFVPIMLMTYIVEKVEDNRNRKIANEILIEKEENNHQRNLAIKSENLQDNELIIVEDDFLYAQSSNNYCTIFYLENKLNKKILLRLSLKNLGEQLDNEYLFIRCHKSFLVNKSRIKSIEGNARSLFLRLENIDEEIPVSRSFNVTKFKEE